MELLKYGKFRAKNMEAFIVILSILVSKSLYYETFGQNALLLPMFIITLGYFFWSSFQRPVTASKSKTILYILIILAIVINPNFAVSSFIVFFLSLSTAFLISSTIDFDRYATVFYTFIRFLMIVSWTKYFFLFTNINPPLPDFVSIIGDHYKNFILFGIYNAGGTFLAKLRNHGLWWEPGAFQIFINLAFLFGILTNKVSKKDYLIFLITIISTLSTAGIIIFSLLSFIYFRKFKKFRLIITLNVLLVALTLTSTQYYKVVIKSKMSLDNPSTRSRFNDTTLALKMFKDHPILGTGFGNIDIMDAYKRQNNYGTGANGILFILANMGILSSLILVPVFFPKFFKRLNLFNRLICSFIMILLFITQNFTIILVFGIILMYGMNNYKKKSQSTSHYKPLQNRNA